ncbi:serine/threonine-protein kinase pim-2-like isoform X2 [Danio rerio]|uniref:Serine/threonine-protein kinase pim-2-like isoform X2 n=1 Tax=Danio rerio TaxID=7955 RepID=A0AC58HHY6_DANRE|nr:serine/threonine-protein kinase pim-2-like [Danio rerio]|eukprot:XP_009290538.1 serine/threonine-protein kinase pim-2-like [Danio rerio]
MGQRNCRSKKANNDFERVHVYHHDAPPQFTNLVEAHEHPVGVGEDRASEGKNEKRKEANRKKKRRFKLWRWFSCLRAAENNSTFQVDGEALDTGVTAAPPEVQPSSSSGDGSLQQVIPTVDLNLQEPSAIDPEVYPTVIQTPTRTTSDWSTDATQTPVHKVSDWSIDVTQPPFHLSTSDCCNNATEIPVPDASEWSANIPRTSQHITSIWSISGGQTPVCTQASVSQQIENNGKMTSQVINSCHYLIDDMLGEGSFGTVYKGRRLHDDFKVAVKFVTKTEDVEYICISGYSEPLPLEVALLILAHGVSNVPEIIQLLDWQDQEDHYIMVLEYPSPCEDLFAFTESYGGSISEGLAQVVMQQATQAAYMCCRHGVLHRDIKLENLLINKETHKVKLIDFGCGDLLKKLPYDTFAGTLEYCPPEFEETGEYNGKPATVWSLGILLFVLVCGDFPNTQELQMINENNYSKAGLSNECCQLISCCLQQKPEQRIKLREILLHEWFKDTNLEN